jgi:transposase
MDGVAGFVEDGRLAIDNNRAENQLRTIAVGRKNWLFAGSFEGARRAALLYSLVQSCKLIDVPPFDNLKDVLLRVATHPQRLIGQLTPKAWAETFHRPNFLVATSRVSRVSWRGRG